MSRFPTHLTLDLPEPVRSGLEAISEQQPEESPEALAYVVLSRGVVVSLDENSSFQGVTLNSKAQRLPSAPVPFGLKMTLDEQHRMEGNHDRESARLKRDLGLAETSEGEAGRGRTLKNLLSEPFRARYQRYLDRHPDMTEAEVVSSLLQRALEQEEAPRTSEMKKTESMVELAERLFAKAARRCLT